MDHKGKWVDIDCQNKAIYFKKFGSSATMVREIYDAFDLNSRLITEPMPCRRISPYMVTEINGYTFFNKRFLTVALIYRTCCDLKEHSKKLLKSL